MEAAHIYVEKLLQAGIVEQKAPRRYFELNSNITYTDEAKKVQLLAIPCKRIAAFGDDRL